MDNYMTIVPYSSLSSTQDLKQDAKLAQACREFESLFLTILWRDMAKSAGMDLGAWDVLLSQSMGRVWAQGGGIGLAKVLYDQLSKSSPNVMPGDDEDGQDT